MGPQDTALKGSALMGPPLRVGTNQMRQIEIFGSHEPNTLEQLRDVASRAERAALMADGHLGYVMPIGGGGGPPRQGSLVGGGGVIAGGGAARPPPPPPPHPPGGRAPGPRRIPPTPSLPRRA